MLSVPYEQKRRNEMKSLRDEILTDEMLRMKFLRK
jgi:hypothetical protein